MTPISQFKNNKLRKLKKATIKGALFLTLSGLIMAQTGCSSSSDTSNNTKSTAQTEVLAKQEFTKGVITTIEEVKKGDFAIADEKTVPTKAESRVIVKYLDGKIDTMNLDQAKTIASANPDGKTEVNSNNSGNRGIGQALWWGVLGYYMGRRTSTPINQNAYKNQSTYQKVNSTTNAEAMSSRKMTAAKKPQEKTGTSGSGGVSGGSRGGASATGKATPTPTTTKTTKPSSSSRGFFNNSSRSSGTSRSFGG